MFFGIFIPIVYFTERSTVELVKIGALLYMKVVKMSLVDSIWNVLSERGRCGSIRSVWCLFTVSVFLKIIIKGGRGVINGSALSISWTV